MKIQIVISGRRYDDAEKIPGQLTLPEGCSVDKALDALAELMHGEAGLPDSCLVAVSGTHLGTLRNHTARQLEEGDDSGYNAQLEVQGGETWKRHELRLADLKLADDKVDENRRLDLDQVRHMLLIDLSGAFGEPGPNTLWVDDVVFFVPGK